MGKKMGVGEPVIIFKGLNRCDIFELLRFLIGDYDVFKADGEGGDGLRVIQGGGGVVYIFLVVAQLVCLGVAIFLEELIFSSRGWNC